MKSHHSSTRPWRARNQLTGIGGSAVAAFQYDAAGRRTSKTVAGLSTSFLYDGMNVIQENAGAAKVLTGSVDEFSQKTDANGSMTPLTDALGSVVALVDASGTVQAQDTYDPFGGTSISGTASGNAAQYTGRENDGTGLYYYRARYYNPALGRFISADPLEFEGSGVNFYAYAGNSPTAIIDPSGLQG